MVVVVVVRSVVVAVVVSASVVVAGLVEVGGVTLVDNNTKTNRHYLSDIVVVKLNPTTEFYLNLNLKYKSKYLQSAILHCPQDQASIKVVSQRHRIGVGLGNSTPHGVAVSQPRSVDGHSIVFVSWLMTGRMCHRALIR